MELLQDHVQIYDNATLERVGMALAKPDYFVAEPREGVNSDIPLGEFGNENRLFSARILESLSFILKTGCHICLSFSFYEQETLVPNA